VAVCELDPLARQPRENSTRSDRASSLDHQRSLGRRHASAAAERRRYPPDARAYLPFRAFSAFSAVSSAWPLGLPNPEQASHPAPA